MPRTSPTPQAALVRSEHLELRSPRGSLNRSSATADARWEVTWAANGTAVAGQFIAGALVRTDSFDADGRLLRTDFHSEPAVGSRGAADAPMSIVLRYVRDGAGALVSVQREVFGHGSAAAPGNMLDPSIQAGHLWVFRPSLVEMGEVLLALGAPTYTTDVGHGVARRITIHYGPGCWLNAFSAFEFDATGLLVGPFGMCICGMCVAAEVPAHAPDVTEVDLHWTAGPWVRLDGSVDVTADHRVMTPTGPRAAGSLRAGDVVLAGDGGVRMLRSVEALREVPPRLGRNLRTGNGVFEAGGILFESEVPRGCVGRGGTNLIGP